MFTTLKDMVRQYIGEHCAGGKATDLSALEAEAAAIRQAWKKPAQAQLAMAGAGAMAGGRLVQQPTFLAAQTQVTLQQQAQLDALYSAQVYAGNSYFAQQNALAQHNSLANLNQNLWTLSPTASKRIPIDPVWMVLYHSERSAAAERRELEWT